MRGAAAKASEKWVKREREREVGVKVKEENGGKP